MNISLTKKKSTGDAWTINYETGYCYSSDGLHICLDTSITDSGAIRALGPFDLSGRANPTLLSSLCCLAEVVENEFSRDHYMVWGLESNSTSEQAVKMSALGIPINWIPNLSMRSFLYRSSKTASYNSISREWNLAGTNLVQHRSGLLFNFNESQPVIKWLDSIDHDLHKKKIETPAYLVNEAQLAHDFLAVHAPI